MKYILALFLAAWLLGPAYGNESVVLTIGGSLKMLKQGHSEVRMVCEKIRAVVNGNRANVRCDFLFKNEGKAVTVRMGFPVASEDTDGDGYTNYPVSSSFCNFKSWVRGKQVKTLYVSPKNDADNHDGRYWGWYVKNVKFGAGEFVRIVDRYDGPLQWWNDQSHCYFGYILETGKNWKGTIGKADLAVTIVKSPTDGKTHLKFYLAEPKPYKMRGNKISWILRNFEPSDDISVCFKDCVDFYGLGLDWLGCHSIENGVTIIKTNSIDGATLKWDKSLKSCTFRCGKRTVQIVDNSRIAIVNGCKCMRLPVAAKVEWLTNNDRYFTVPIATVVRALGGTAYFDKKSQDIYARLP